jgi:hypothetical protein
MAREIVIPDEVAWLEGPLRACLAACEKARSAKDPGAAMEELGSEIAEPLAQIRRGLLEQIRADKEKFANEAARTQSETSRK